MNYRHAFHAGNFADVLKHVVLVDLLVALQAKPGAISYIDTHAGRGLYDLGADEALRTGESLGGIARLHDDDALPASLRRYLDIVRAFQRPDAPSKRYPGSPAIAQRLMRTDDRAIVCELHPEDVRALRATLHGDPRFAIHARDGYAALKALTPPTPRRGLALVDPPFEDQGREFATIQRALADANARWPNGVVAIWYPIKQRETVRPFHRWLRDALDTDVLALELLLHPDTSALRLNGCGVAIVNPPWRFDETARDWMPVLAARLATDGAARATVSWLRDP